MKRKNRMKVLASVCVATLTLTACQGMTNKDGTSNGGSTMEQDSSTGSGNTKSDSAEVKKISAEEAYEMMQGEEAVVIVDVRTEEEYAEKHIPNAILIPNETIEDTPPAELPVKDAVILVYCRSGNRSAQAAKKLLKMGYSNLYDFGGINDWTFETESGEADHTKKTGSFSSFKAYDLYGVPKDENIFKNHKLTMVNIWATFCGPCLQEMPEIGELAKEYESKGLQVIGIPVDVPYDKDGTYQSAMVEKTRRLVEQTKADYVHLLPSEDLGNAKLKGVSSVPETIFVDETGTPVGDSYVGARSGDAWKKIIDSML